MDQINLRVAMKALIVNIDSKILLLREASTYEEGTQLGRYHLPGGRINPGENFEDGLKREVREETGLEIDLKYPVYVGEWRPTIKGEKNQIVATFFVCFAKSTEVTLSKEHDKYSWIAPEERHKLDIMDPEDKVIDRYVEWQEKGLPTTK